MDKPEFMKYQHNCVVRTSHVGMVDGAYSAVTFMAYGSRFEVAKKYEQAWRDMFDLNDKENKDEIPF